VLHPVVLVRVLLLTITIMRALLLTLSLLLLGCGDFDSYDRRQLSPTGDGDRRIIINGGGDNTPAPPQDGGAPPAPDQGAPLHPDQGAPLLPDQGAPPPTGQCGMGTFEEEVFKLVNVERAKGGLAPYACSAEAVKVSRAYSQLMCQKGFFSHTGPGGTTPSSRFQAAGVGYSSWVGENIAYGASTPAAVMKMWMSSSGHRAAIMSGSFTHIGVGYEPCDSGSGGWLSGKHYWVQNFFIPK